MWDLRSLTRTLSVKGNPYSKAQITNLNHVKYEAVLNVIRFRPFVYFLSLHAVKSKKKNFFILSFPFFHVTSFWLRNGRNQSYNPFSPSIFLPFKNRLFDTVITKFSGITDWVLLLGHPRKRYHKMIDPLVLIGRLRWMAKQQQLFSMNSSTATSQWIYLQTVYISYAYAFDLVFLGSGLPSTMDGYMRGYSHLCTYLKTMCSFNGV